MTATETTSPILGLSSLRVGATAVRVDGTCYGVIDQIDGHRIRIDTGEGIHAHVTLAVLCDSWRLVRR